MGTQRPAENDYGRSEGVISYQEPEEQLDLFGAPSPTVVKPVDWDTTTVDHPLRLASPLPSGLYLGTSSWSFPGWGPGLVYSAAYSEQRLAERGLAAYAACPLFRCVSLDRSYYRPPQEPEFANLRSQVPGEFRFIVKTPRDLLVPHPSHGFDLEMLQRHFLGPASRGLGSSLGVILLQFPPGSWRAAGSARGFTRHLGHLLQRLPSELFYSLELRDPELLTPELATALQGTTVGLCASVHPKLPALEKQLLAIPPTPGTPVVFRWNLRPSLNYQQAQEDFRPFDSLRSPDTARRDRLAHLIARALQAGRTVYATANNKAEGCAPLSLRALLDRVIAVQSARL